MKGKSIPAGRETVPLQLKTSPGRPRCLGRARVGGRRACCVTEKQEPGTRKRVSLKAVEILGWSPRLSKLMVELLFPRRVGGNERWCGRSLPSMRPGRKRLLRYGHGLGLHQLGKPRIFAQICEF